MQQGSPSLAERGGCTNYRKTGRRGSMKNATYVDKGGYKYSAYIDFSFSILGINMKTAVVNL